jgi:hypothetical protein
LAVLQCAGCPRFISVSITGGANPVALADPQRWSVTRWQCRGCQSNFCDRCAPGAQRACPRCARTTAASATGPAPGDDESALEVSMDALRSGRRMLWIAVAAAVFSIPALFAGRTGFFIMCWIASFLAGLSGIGEVARALDANRLVKYLSLVAVFMPLAGLAPLVYYLARAHGAMKSASDAGELRGRQAAAQQARQRAAAREPAASRAPPQPRPPQPASPSRPPQPASPARSDTAAAARELAGAIACVKLAGLADRPEGERLRARVTGPGMDMPEEAEPAMSASKGVFGVCYLVDRGDVFGYANMGQLRAAQMTLDELHRIGLLNLAAMVNGKPGLRVHPQGNVHGLIMGGQFEASLVLLDELWDGPLKAQAPDGAVVTIAARDICAFCDARSLAGIAELKRLAARVSQGGDHLVSDKLFIRKDGRWREFDDGARADLPPLEFE